MTQLKLKDRVIVTISVSIGPTSMPLQEFVLYRGRCFRNEQQVLVAFNRISPEARDIYEEELSNLGVTVFDCQGNFLRMVWALREIANSCRASRKRAIVHGHHPKLFLVVLLVSRLFGLDMKAAFTIHSTFANYSLLNKITSAFCGLLANYLTFNSESSFASYPRIVTRSKKGWARTILNGIDTDQIEEHLAEMNGSGHAARKGPGCYRLITVGRLVDAKNQDFLIRLLPRLPEEVELVIVGDGPLKKRLEIVVGECKVGRRVHLLGQVSRERVYNELMRSDVFVSSSLWEGFGNAVIEAMFCGLPVVLSDIPAYMEIAEQARKITTLRLDTEKWVKTLLELRDQGEETLKARGEENRRAVISHFSLRRMHTEYAQVYDELARGKAI
jgi:glycosyltransferase involved in cell wall biosynthesis